MVDLRSLAASVCLALCHLTPSLAAAEITLERQVSIELNAVQPADGACTLSFLIINGHETDIAKAVFEAVLFDASEQVDRLMLLDFGTLPVGRPRVRQFLVQGMGCDQLSQILINGAHLCEGADLPGRACSKDLLLSTKTDIKVLG